MSDTPETDAHSPSSYAIIGPDGVRTDYVPAEFARKLERERDEAIAARKDSAADWLNQVEQANKRVSRALQQAALADQYLDKARTELEMWRDGNILHEIHRDELEKVERERDEARAQRDEWIARFRADEELIENAMLGAIPNPAAAIPDSGPGYTGFASNKEAAK